MPFTDTQLVQAMRNNLVAAGVMTDEQLQKLLDDPTENNVRDTLTKEQLANFQAYWNALGEWMELNGGNRAQTTGTNAPGRVGGNPAGLAAIALYNDAFRDVNAHIEDEEAFLPVKAVSNQLRFIENMGDDDDDD